MAICRPHSLLSHLTGDPGQACSRVPHTRDPSVFFTQIQPCRDSNTCLFKNALRKKIRVGASGTARGHRFISQIMRRPGAQGHPCTTARICGEQGGLRNSDSTQQPRAVKKKPSTTSSRQVGTWILHSVWGRALLAVALGHLFSPIFIMMLQVPAQPVITSESSALFPSLASLCVNLKT